VNGEMMLYLEAKDRLERRIHTQKTEKVFQMLEYAGFVEDTGERERNHKTGEMRSVWQLTERGKAEWEAVSEKPGEFEECLAECLAEFEKYAIVGH
jgi:DNA-binding PadR family transcriptional regulator